MTDADAHFRQKTYRRPLVISATFAILAATLVTTILIREQRVDADHLREARLQAGLRSIRHAIASYRAKNGRSPRELSELVRDGQLRRIPPDPITGTANTWHTIVEEQVRIDDFKPGSSQPERLIIDVRSGAPGHDAGGKPWSEY